jgi:hypothetical protein
MASFDPTLSPPDQKIDLNRTIRPWSPSVTRLHLHQDPNESLIRFDEHNETFITDDNIKTLRLTTEGILRFLHEIRHDHVNQITTLQSSIREIDEQLKSQRTHSTLEIEKLHQAIGSKNLRSKLQGLQSEIVNAANQSKLDVSQVMKEIQNWNDSHLARDNELVQLVQSTIQQTLQPLYEEHLDIKQEGRLLRLELEALKAQHLEDQVQIRQLVESQQTSLCKAKVEILECIGLSKVSNPLIPEVEFRDQLQKQSIDLVTLLGEVRQTLIDAKSSLQAQTKSRVSDENVAPVSPSRSKTAFGPPGTTPFRGDSRGVVQQRLGTSPAAPAMVPGAPGSQDYSTPQRPRLSTPKISIPKPVKEFSTFNSTSYIQGSLTHTASDEASEVTPRILTELSINNIARPPAVAGAARTLQGSAVVPQKLGAPLGVKFNTYPSGSLKPPIVSTPKSKALTLNPKPPIIKPLALTRVP